jgi:hypothetical protein
MGGSGEKHTLGAEAQIFLWPMRPEVETSGYLILPALCFVGGLAFVAGVAR